MNNILQALIMLNISLIVMLILLMLASHYNVKYKSWKMWTISIFGILAAILFGKLVGFI